VYQNEDEEAHDTAQHEFEKDLFLVTAALIQVFETYL
jgi:hypothetical protein